jgi:hypothetical protein
VAAQERKGVEVDGQHLEREERRGVDQRGHLQEQPAQVDGAGDWTLRPRLGAHREHRAPRRRHRYQRPDDHPWPHRTTGEERWGQHEADRQPGVGGVPADRRVDAVVDRVEPARGVLGT